MLLVFGWEACGILSSWQGSKCEPCALEGNVLATGPPGKPLKSFFFNLFFSKQFHCKYSARCIWLRNLIWDCLGSTPHTPELTSFLPSGNLLTLSKCHCPHLENRDFKSAYFMVLYEGLYEIFHIKQLSITTGYTVSDLLVVAIIKGRGRKTLPSSLFFWWEYITLGDSWVQCKRSQPSLHIILDQLKNDIYSHDSTLKWHITLSTHRLLLTSPILTMWPARGHTNLVSLNDIFIGLLLAIVYLSTST